MDSLFLQRTENLVSSGGLRSGGGGGESGLREDNENNHIPAWKLPLASSLIGNSSNRQQQQHHHNGYENKPTVHHHKISIESSSSSSSSNNNINLKTVAISPELAEDEATAQLIQILLPCIICNRTFSPEALERHSKICTAVNEKSPLKPNRGKFDSAEQRKKDTKLESFIPPPEIDSNGEFVRSGSRRFRDSFSRGSKNRSSLGKTSTTTTTTTNNSSSSLIPTWRKGITSPLKPSHSLLEHHNNKSMLLGNEPFEDNSEFGSEESQDAISNADGPPINLPHYARALSPSEDCPYCGRNFGMKAFDRHVKFCKELYIRKQYDIQPIPDEKKEALERQELRTKYRQMKGSNSCGSLRSMSPPKDFPSMMAMKLYGFMNKTFNRNNFKKSNESLTNSCYGDYTRSMRRTSPAPSMMSNSSIGMGMGHHHNQHHQIPKAAMVYQRSNSTCSPMSVNSKGSSVMKVNTTSNIPKRTKSIENLASVQCSGYGNGGGQQQYSNNSHGGGGNSFTRNSKTRSSLHKNFFRNSAKRAEPEGTENTQSGSPGALIITPMSFYSKGKNYHGNSSASFLQQQQHKQQQHVGANNNPNNSNTTMMMMNRNNNMRNHDNNGGGELMSEHHHHGLKKGILSSDPHYDPYEKAARQFEELLKSQPPTNRINSNKQQSRKTGLDRAFQSVVIPEPDYDNSSPTPPPPPLHNNQDNPRYPSILNKTSILDTSYSNNDSDKMEVNSSSSPTTTTINSNVNPPADNDRLLSYWEQILQSDHHHLNKSVQETQEDSQAVSSDSDHSKSRDSAFSRSDGADLEFEALESMLSVGDEPSPQQPQPPSNNKDGPVQKPSLLPTVIGSTRKSSSDHGMVSSSPLSIVHSQSQQRQNSIGTLDTTTTTLPSLLSSSSSSTPNQHPHHHQEYKHLSRFQNGNENNYANHHHSSGGGNKEYSTTDQKSFSKPSVSSSGGNGNGALARFCYECGTCYPTPTAKFCPECGERRVMK